MINSPPTTSQGLLPDGKLQEENQKLQKKFKSLEEELKDSFKVQEELEQKVQSLQRENSELNNNKLEQQLEIQLCQEELLLSKISDSGNSGKLRKRNNKIKKIMEAYAGKISNLNKQLEELQKNIKNDKKTNKELSKQIEKLQSELNKSTKQIKKLEKKITSMTPKDPHLFNIVSIFTQPLAHIFFKRLSSPSSSAPNPNKPSSQFTPLKTEEAETEKTNI